MFRTVGRVKSGMCKVWYPKKEAGFFLALKVVVNILGVEAEPLAACKVVKLYFATNK